MNNPAFSIITITKDDPGGFEKTMKSVQEQTCRDFEWIVIATDTAHNGTLDIIRQNMHDITFLAYNQDTGLYNAMNIGTDQATGDYMIFLNGGDSLFDEKVLEYTKDIAQRTDYPEYLYGNQANVDENGRVKFYETAPADKEALIQRPASHQSLFFKREAYERMGLRYDESMKIAADTGLKIQFAQNAQSFHKMDLIVNTFDTTGISNARSWRQVREGYKIRRTIRKQSFSQAALSMCRPIIATAMKNYTPALFEVAKKVYHGLNPNISTASVENNAILFNRHNNPQ